MAKAATQPYTDTQFQRMQRIHKALIENGLPPFRSKGMKNANSLFEGFSERTFYNLMDQLKLYAEAQGAKVSFNHALNRYTCTKRFSLYMALFPDEKNLVSDMAAAMDWVRRLNDFAGLDDVFLKLEDRAGVLSLARETVVQYEQNRQYSGQCWLSPLYEAIRQDKPAWISYTEFGCEPVRLLLSPYLLKEYNNRWHVYGYVQHHPTRSDGLLNLALDRIDTVKLADDLRRRPCDIDWQTYLADVIGFTRTDGEPLQNWLVRVWFPRANYVLTKPLHHSQQVVQRTSEFVDFQYRLLWNRELEAALFELGPDAELLEPADKRAEFAEKVQRLMGRYC